MYKCPDIKTHNVRLTEVLKRASEYGIKFNAKKCKFSIKEITFLGHKFSEEGLMPDPAKIKAVQEMPTPNNRKDLERFLGTVNYLSKFIPNYSSVTHPLRIMLKKDICFQWNSEQEAAFVKLKSLLASPPVLTYYDPSKELTMSVDCSNLGLGAVLLCEDKPIAYASRALTPTQSNYCQIEKEMLAIVFGCSRFHQYIFGRKVTVESDHKPLETLFKKSIVSVPLRLQRMMLKVQRYDLNVVYKPGRFMYIADTLSRAPLPVISKEEIDELDNDIICQINMFKSNLPISEIKLKLFKEETVKDKCLSIVKQYIKSGWPDKSLVDELVLPFWNVRHELHVIDDLVYKNNSLVVPKELQNQMLELLHNGHVGKQTCDLRARNLLYWPNISDDIRNKVEGCEVCAKFKPNNCREPIMFHDVPNLPWNKISGDIFEYKGQHFLVVMDYYSKFIELVSLPNLTSKTVIEKCKSFFARHGIPLVFVADAGSQFTAREFHEFAKLYEFEVVIVSPKHSQSNGQAESGVKIAKNLLKKSEESNADVYLCLLDYRNTAKPYQPSPAELLFSRKLNSRLPMSKSSLEPKVTKPNPVVLHKRRESIRKYYNKKSNELSELYPGDRIYFKKNEKSSWTPGTVLSKGNIPRSYVVCDDSDSQFARNRKLIRPGPKTPEMSLPPKGSELRQSTPRSCNSDLSRLPQVEPNPVETTESEVVKHFDGYVTRRGRLVKNPKRLTFD